MFGRQDIRWVHALPAHASTCGQRFSSSQAYAGGLLRRKRQRRQCQLRGLRRRSPAASCLRRGLLPWWPPSVSSAKLQLPTVLARLLRPTSWCRRRPGARRRRPARRPARRRFGLSGAPRSESAAASGGNLRRAPLSESAPASSQISGARLPRKSPASVRTLRRAPRSESPAPAATARSRALSIAASSAAEGAAAARANSTRSAPARLQLNRYLRPFSFRVGS